MFQDHEDATIHIVTPCLNAAEFIDATLKSVITQQGNFHLRYHVQDGASTDDTITRLKRWGQSLQTGTIKPRCKSFAFSWRSAPCKSLYDAIDQGFSQMNIGPDDFMTWLNADDILFPDAIERVARVAKRRQDVRWLSGVTHIVDPNGATLGYAPLSQCPQDVIAAGLCDKQHWEQIHQSGSFWRHNLYLEVGGLDQALTSAGDWDLWRRFAHRTQRYVLPVSLGLARHRPGHALINPNDWHQEIDSKLPLTERIEASRRLIVPRPSYLSPQLPDPILAPSITGDDKARAEAWRQRVCPETPWPRITIVTPSFNQGIFLDACMRSVLDQGYPNLEYIVMDGGSMDNSLSVIRKHAERLAYWQSGPDGGQYKAIMEGLNRGTGEIMAWLNADDLYFGPCLFKVAMQFMTNPKTRWIAGRPAVCDQMSKIGSHRDLQWSHAGILNVSGALKDQFLGQDAVFWRRDLWVETGSKLDWNYSLAADFDLWVRFSRIAPIYTIQDIFSAYRHHGDQRAVTLKKEYITQMCDIVERELQELLKQHLPENFFTCTTPQPMTYADTLAPLTGMPRPDALPIENPGQGIHSLSDLQQSLTLTRQSLTRITSYYEAMHLDDMCLHAHLAYYINKARCISFDCFDTILYRLCDEPTRLFLEVGRRLQSSGNINPQFTPEQFKQLRIAAESKARLDAMERRRTSECSIEEIYMQLKSIVPDIMQGVKTEILTEQEFCHANPSIIGLLRYYKSQGYKIAILSDNYLSSKQLSSILEYNGVDINQIDLILTSRDAKAGKYEGKMYRIAASKMNISPHEILHIGDNEQADVKAAHAVGVRGVLYPRHPGNTRRVMQREHALHHPERHATSLASFRTLAHRLGGQIRPEWRGYYQDGAFLFGPALARYADWVVQQCRQEGITCCLAFMREAQTLMPLIQRSASAAGYSLEVRPFYVSRHSINLASMFEVTPKTIFEKTAKHRKCSPKTLLKALGLPEDKLSNFDTSHLNTPLNDPERFSFAQIVAKDPLYHRLLEARTREARHAFIEYSLSQFGNHKRLAVADIGFRGTIQLNMERILRHEQIDNHLTGLYFCTQIAAANAVLEGSDIRSFLGNLGAWKQETQTLYTHPEILEQAVNAVCGTTLGYSKQDSGTYQPDLEEVSIPFEQMYKRWLIQLGIMSFQKIWLDFSGRRLYHENNFRTITPLYLQEIDSEILYIMQRLFCFPTSEEAKRLGSLYHDDNDGTDTGGIICDTESRKIFCQGGVDKLFSEKVYWPHGVIGIEAQNIIDQLFALKIRLQLP